MVSDVVSFASVRRCSSTYATPSDHAWRTSPYRLAVRNPTPRKREFGALATGPLSIGESVLAVESSPLRPATASATAPPERRRSGSQTE